MEREVDSRNRGGDRDRGEQVGEAGEVMVAW